MEEEDPNRPSIGNSAVGQCIRGQDLEVSRPEEAPRLPTTLFESSGGSGLQQGSGNTMTVKINNNYYGNDTVAGHQSENNTSNQWISWKKDTVVSVGAVVALVAVLVAGYLNSTPNIQSPSLPSIALGFTGREDEVNSILDAIVSGTGRGTRDHPAPSIVNIVGAPGFGKSALAIAVGHALLRHGIYVYYVDINNLHKVKVAVTAILITVIDGTVSSDPHYLYRWAGRLKARTVVILDNCDSFLNDEATRNEFLDFLSKLGKLSSKKLSLLTTSQYHFTILDPPVKTVRLGQLRENASESLLQFMYRQLTKTDAKEFAQLAGYNPLALKVTGALLQDSVPVAELKEELKQNPIQTLSPEENRSEDQVRACILSSFSRLSEQLQQALVTLAHIPGTFDESDANAILNVTNSSVYQSLTRRLRRRCLVEFEDKSKRYSVHSLIVAFAKENEHSYIKPWETERMIVRHYFRKFKDLGIRYHKEPFDVLKLYDVNQQNFQHLFETLVNSSNHGSGDHRKKIITSRSFSQLAIKSDRLIHARMLPSQQVRWYKTALRRSKTLLDSQFERRDENKETVCQIICLLVEALVKGRDVADATMEVKRDTELIRTCTEKYRIRIVITICFDYSTIGHMTEENLKCHQRMLEPLALRRKPIESFIQLGNYYYLAGYIQQAYECYSKANTIQDYDTDTTSDPIEWSKQVVSMLDTYTVLDKANAGVALWKEWIENTFDLMSDKFELTPQAALELTVLGSNLFKASMHDIALKVYFKALKVQREVFGEHHVDTLTSLIAIGRIYFKDGDYNSALQYFNRSLPISNRTLGPDTDVTTTLLVDIGNTLDRLSREDAVDYWKQALEIRTRLGHGDIEMLQLLDLIASWHVDRFQFFSSFDYHTRAYYIAGELKEEDQTVSPNAEPKTVPSTSTSTELQSISGWVNFRTVVSPFIRKYKPYLFQLKRDANERARAQRTKENEHLVQTIYMYYMFYYLVGIGVVLCAAICAIFCCIDE